MHDTQDLCRFCVYLVQINFQLLLSRPAPVITKKWIVFSSIVSQHYHHHHRLHWLLLLKYKLISLPLSVNPRLRTNTIKTIDAWPAILTITQTSLPLSYCNGNRKSHCYIQWYIYSQDDGDCGLSTTCLYIFPFFFLLCISRRTCTIDLSKIVRFINLIWWTVPANQRYSDVTGQNLNWANKKVSCCPILLNQGSVDQLVRKCNDFLKNICKTSSSYTRYTDHKIHVVVVLNHEIWNIKHK